MIARAIVAIAFLAISSTANAAQVICFLEVDGQIYLQGRCTYVPDPNGSFSIGTDDPAGKYFAYLATSAPNEATGFWNGTAGGTHAHEDLGKLHRNGGCWVNDTAKICAWR
ncbi:hypothetical protein [Rhizobium sp. AC27/96]|uniref:hypothetical protein n=1 Tax=Rhizobium sp. AC27/96 TaxID=1841653 RepID=UPI001146C0C7|nr:hypothetical protein [Rhizobium sp. AC27/96]